MHANDELSRLRRRLEHIERELTEARAQLATLEAVASPAKPVQTRETAPKEEFVSAEPPPLPRVTVLPQVPLVQGMQAVARVEPVAEQVPEPEAAPLRAWMERLQLWPPAAGEGDAEARLGAWWATRVGTLLAVIGVVFFGMQISLNAPAWVKFCQLLAVSAGVSAFGAWLERRLPAFGAVVFAGGLALLFFTAYAGHAVAAVRVFDGLGASLVAQAVAVGLIVGAALWRRSSLIATLAIGLGQVTAMLSMRADLGGIALGAAAALALVAVALHRMRGWEAPSVVAMPAAYAVGALALGQGLPPTGMPVFIAGLAAVFFLRDWRRVPVAVDEVTAGERWFQNVNAGGAVLLGWATVWSWARAELGGFYLAAAVALAFAAWVRTRQVRGGDLVAAVLTAKAVGALTLGVIELLDARTVALALLAQAWVLAWTARRIASRVLAAGAGVAAAVAVYFYFGYGVGEAQVLSARVLAAVLFTAGLALWSVETGRWLLRDDGMRRGLALAGGTLAAAGALVMVVKLGPAQGLPSWALGWALVFAAGAAWRRASAAAGAAAVIGAFAQGCLWVAAGENHAPGVLAGNALAVLLPTVAAGAWLGRQEGAAWRAGGTLAWAAAIIGAGFCAFGLWAEPYALGAMLVLALALAACAPLAPARHLPWLATLAAGVGAWLGLTRGLGEQSVPGLVFAAGVAWALPLGLRAWARVAGLRRAEPQPETMERLQVLVAAVLGWHALAAAWDGPALSLGLAVYALGMFVAALRPGVRPALFASLAGWGLVALSVLWARPGQHVLLIAAALAWLPLWVWERVPARWRDEFIGWRAHAPAVQGLCALLIGALVAEVVFIGTARVLVLLALMMAAALTARPGGSAVARVLAVPAAGFVMLGAGGLVITQGAEGWSGGFVAVGLAALGVAALAPWLDAARSRGWRLAGGGAALGLIFLLWSEQVGALAPYATVGWGLAAIGLFLAGLFWRNAPYRLLGLAGLALCVSRVFVVDLQSTLHRVAAFIVVGLVLLVVGFSYQHFRHLLTDSADRPDNSSPRS